MSRIILSFALIASTYLTSLNAHSSFFELCDAFLFTNVQNGKVNYGAILLNPGPMEQLVGQIGSFHSHGDKTEELAFYINAYNVLVIKQLMDHYPVDSPLSVEGFFDKTTFKVAGKQLTLNQLENDIIRPEFKDPRIHFALVCGANGCPPIYNRVYAPNSLSDQLNKSTSNALNDNQFVKIGAEKVELSEIMKWYGEDFGNNESEIIDYINQYRATPISKSLNIGYYSYDWKINE